MIKVHWICWQPTPYNDFLFRSLAADPEVDLTVHFREKVVASHPWTSDMAQGFRWRTFQHVLGLDWHLLHQAARDKQSFFIIGGWDNPTAISLINLLILYRRRFAIWTDTPRIHEYRSPMKATARAIWLRWVFRHSSYILGTGDPALSVLLKMGCPKEKLINFPYFIDLDLFSPQLYAGDETVSKDIMFLSSGRLVSSIKGHDLAIRALALARDLRSINTHNFKYRIAGVGPDKDALLCIAHQLDLADKVELVGWLEPSQLPDFYRSGSVLLHPSHIDNYSTTVLEAMACSLAVIGSDATGAIVDRIRHGDNGLIHRTGDFHDLAVQIAFVLDHPETIPIMGARARMTVEEWSGNRAVAIIKDLLHSSGT